MANENLLLQATRIPRFNGIETPPQLFFTVNDGKHTQSMKIIDALARAHLTNAIAITSPSCIAFDNWDAIPEDLSKNSVIIFDERLGANCFSALCWEENIGRRQFLHFQRLEVLWGFAVNSMLDESRIAAAVNQLRADFGTKFLEQIDKGKFPWGDRPKLQIQKEAQKPTQRKRKRDQGHRRRQRRDGDPLYSICMW